MRKYLKLHTVIRTNPKVRALPSDADRWHYVLALVASKDASPEGEWLGEDYFRAAVDPGTAKRLDLFIERELLAREDDGRIIVPNYAEWQASDQHVPAARRDPDTLERVREQQRKRSKEYRDRHRNVMPASRDASCQVSKEGMKEQSVTDADGDPDGPSALPSCARCGKDIPRGGSSIDFQLGIVHREACQ